jgi:hypothetical protein
VPPPGKDLGWRSRTYNLSAFKGQYVRITFANRNLWDTAEAQSLGIWTYLDDVKVLDTGPAPAPAGLNSTFIPLLSMSRCDN